MSSHDARIGPADNSRVTGDDGEPYSSSTADADHDGTTASNPSHSAIDRLRQPNADVGMAVECRWSIEHWYFCEGGIEQDH